MVNQILEEILKQAYEMAGYKNSSCKAIESNRPEISDYQCDDSFKLAKEFKTSPLIISQKTVEKLNDINKEKNYFSKIEAMAPGFINLSLSKEFLNQQVQKLETEPKFNIDKPKSEETYFLDYGGPNVAKPLHVGHLRSAVVGESIKRIINFAGHKTVSDVHLGDYGLQIGQVIYGLKQKGLSVNDITLEILEDIYPKISALCKTDETVKEICANITKEMQDGHEEYNQLQKVILEISGNDILNIYKYLDVKFDVWEGESNSYEHIAQLKDILTKQNLLKESQGALIVEVENENNNFEMPPLIFQKSNGAYLYGTTDLASILDRAQKFKPNHFIYVVDNRQALHFKQVFSVAKLSNINKGATLEHCGFGTVNGLDGKPYKTRSGDAPKLTSLFNQVREVYVAIKEENKTANVSDLDKIVNAIIKYADLQNHREKDYIFDINKFSNVVGKTGPYVLYSYLRINKILNDNQNQISQKLNNEIYGEEDKNLRLKLIAFPAIFKSAFEEKLPSVIADYIYDLSVEVNAFYEKNRINEVANLEQKGNWLFVLNLSKNLIKTLLELLAIYTPSVM